MNLDQLKSGAFIHGILAGSAVKVIQTEWASDDAVNIVYEEPGGAIQRKLFYRSDECQLEVVERERIWAFDGDGGAFRLAAEAQRIHLAHLFDPFLALSISRVDPLPHQITAVYGEMLQRQPLRFLLADDPGAGKTIMSGLLIKELMIRGDLDRCLIVAPGSLVEQWQDELREKFGLEFDLLSRDLVESSASGNPFVERPRWIARLDMLSRNDELQAKLFSSDEWDLIVCDEAHRMSASYAGSEPDFTKRYRLGERLSGACRHFLLMTATPHNGKEPDFQLFMKLIDPDRFEGKPRSTLRKADVGDMMRRLTKEELRTFDDKPLFPPRRAYTAEYDLSPKEALLYESVTTYVRHEMNRADRLAADDNQRRQNVGFALQILQRRLASSPAAIHELLKRRLERLEKRLAAESSANSGADRIKANPSYRIDLLDDLDDASQDEIELTEAEIVDSASAAQTIEELKIEIEALRDLERRAQDLRRSPADDTKWSELNSILDHELMTDDAGNRRKLIIFTEPRDTLAYLSGRIRNRFGRVDAVVEIHGGVSRDARRQAVDAFLNDPKVLVMVANDAAGEGVNLQKAHLMVNYDLPWNPNRLEQRFGRIHRIGQTEVCHLWNLVAKGTREGDVYARLLKKLEIAREALGGRVFDVLGEMFEAKPLADLLVEAIRHGEDKVRFDDVCEEVEQAVGKEHLLDLLNRRALVQDSMPFTKVQEIREQMERAEARRLQPHYIQSFFEEAFVSLGGRCHRRETGRFEISRVPGSLRQAVNDPHRPIQPRYERIFFDKANGVGLPPSAFLCPGHPLLDATIIQTLDTHRDLLRRGAILIDSNDDSTTPRLLVALDQQITDGRRDRQGRPLAIVRQLSFVDLDAEGRLRDAGPAPYLDYRPATAAEQAALKPILDEPWLQEDLEARIVRHAVTEILPAILDETRTRRHAEIDKIEHEVKCRLQGEMIRWDRRAEELRAQEKAGKSTRLSASNAAARADDLKSRLERRFTELAKERDIQAVPPVIQFGALIVPAGRLLALGLTPDDNQMPEVDPVRRREIERLAMDAVMAAERALGFEPRDVGAQKVGYDVESRRPDGVTRCIEVKGVGPGRTSVCLTRNEIFHARNLGDRHRLAIVQVEGITPAVPAYVSGYDFGELNAIDTSKNTDLKALLAMAHPPH